MNPGWIDGIIYLMEMEKLFELLEIVLFFYAILHFGVGILLAVIGWSTMDERNSDPTVREIVEDVAIGLLLIVAWPILIWWYRKKY